VLSSVPKFALTIAGNKRRRQGENPMGQAEAFETGFCKHAKFPPA
jgi:hypothetical protein